MTMTLVACLAIRRKEYANQVWGIVYLYSGPYHDLLSDKQTDSTLFLCPVRMPWSRPIGAVPE